jgi:hypothetical protein
MHKAAVWFLFESEHAFFVVCAEAGIDAGKLRHHLQDFHSVNKYLRRVLLTIVESKA